MKIVWLSIYVYVPIKEIGSGALPGLMLDIGLLKIIGEVFFIFLASAGGSNPAGTKKFLSIFINNT